MILVGRVPLLELDLARDRPGLSSDEFLEVAHRVRGKTFDPDYA